MDQHRCYGCMQPLEEDRCPHCGWTRGRDNEPHQLPVGTVLQGRYEIGRVLGQGGFGITYLGWDIQLQTTICIKEYFPNRIVSRDCALSTQIHCHTDAEAESYRASKERFLREGRILAQFRDIPEIVSIYGYFEANDTVYIVMEYIRGMDLAHYIQSRGGRIGVDETFRILWPVMRALAQVHRGGLVHRDIAPDNIMLHPRGGAKLLDFGAARMVENANVEKGLDRSTEAIVKHGFAPMEQYQTRGSLGPWTDEYAMCATIWYCLTGQIPPEATTRMLGEGDIDWRSVPGLTQRQCAALEKGMAVRARDRYPSMEDLLQDLAEAPAVPTPPPAYRTNPATQVPPSGVQATPVSPSGVQATPVPVKTKKSFPLWAKLCAVAVPIVAVAAVAVVLLLPRSGPAVTVDDKPEQPRAEAVEATDPTSRVDVPSPGSTEADPTEEQYQQACALLEEGRYGEAYPILFELEKLAYKDSAELLAGYRWALTEQVSEDWQTKYDLMGHQIWFMGLNEDGSSYSSEMEYDAEGRLVKEVYTDNYLDDPFSVTTYYYYDAAGNCVRREHVYLDSYYSTDEYLMEYDAEGRIIKETNKYGNGDYTDVSFYTYTGSEDGRYTRTDVTRNGEPSWCSEEQLDEEGRLVYHRTYYYGDYGGDFVYRYKYDSRGEIIEEYIMRDDGYSDEYDEEYTIYYTYSYDANGDVVSYEYRDTYGIEYVSEYIRNEYGIIVQFRDTYPDGTVKLTERTIVLTYNGEQVAGY